MTAIEFHILNSYDPVFYHHRGLTSQSDLLSDFLSGFRKKHSTETALVCSHYSTMLMLRVGGSLRGVLQRVTPPTEPCISNYITEEYLK